MSESYFPIQLPCCQGNTLVWKSSKELSVWSYTVPKFIKVALQYCNLTKSFLTLAEHTSLSSCRGLWLQVCIYSSHRITCNSGKFGQAELEECCYSCAGLGINHREFRPASRAPLHVPRTCRGVIPITLLPYSVISYNKVSLGLAWRRMAGRNPRILLFLFKYIWF